MVNPVGELLQDLRRGLGDLYGPRLRGVYLFGSYARGEARADSDVDVLIVLDHVEGYAAELERTGPLVSELSLREGVSISRVLVTERDWSDRQTPFLGAIAEEVVPA